MSSLQPQRGVRARHCLVPLGLEKPLASLDHPGYTLSILPPKQDVSSMALAGLCECLTPQVALPADSPYQRQTPFYNDSSLYKLP